MSGIGGDMAKEQILHWDICLGAQEAPGCLYTSNKEGHVKVNGQKLDVLAVSAQTVASGGLVTVTLTFVPRDLVLTVKNTTEPVE